MIDTCDPEVACWSEDGETFVVKDPVKFERTIIPQFFKHSKFSSFVRVSDGPLPCDAMFRMLTHLFAAATELLLVPKDQVC